MRHQEVVNHPPLMKIAEEMNVTMAQLIFAFARAIGILPLTGTSEAEHMKQDLDSLKLDLPPRLVEGIESIAG
jgi:aryl-alcohol dehydrogenase-like predicted oxidoreductase